MVDSNSSDALMKYYGPTTTNEVFVIPISGNTYEAAMTVSGSIVGSFEVTIGLVEGTTYSYEILDILEVMESETMTWHIDSYRPDETITDDTQSTLDQILELL
mmetsp:Transcript_39098/g.37406  ORF Transcript_39098/g.37406 Transcript_39098/m.37406 type:complete len:103 (+) Transcript_39098:4100-4408(+)